MEFDDANAMSMASSGTVSVEVVQPVNVELSPFTVPNQINAGETVQLSFQVMNLGRAPVYNVRVELDVPGLSPSGNAFIGNMEPGTSAEQTLNVFAGMKDEGERYGYTSGVARLIYEDAGGREYTAEAHAGTEILELVIAGADDAQAQEEARQEEARNIQWWVFLAAGGAAAAAVGLGLYLKKRTGGRHSR